MKENLQRLIEWDENKNRLNKILINEPSLPTEAEIKNFRNTALKELVALNNSDDEIFCDEDCHELTDEQLEILRPVHTLQGKFRLTAR